MSTEPTAAEKAIKAFPFWNYGLDEVDPESEFAEWLPALAAKVEVAVRAQVAAEILAAKGTDARFTTGWASTQDRDHAAAIARGGER